uniref:hypothetical protein n=1 Tax=Oscillatoria sp. HE19RPO TaxID=2954806 RepID=UPI0020C274E5
MASKGSNFVNDFNDLGSSLSDLQVEFRVGTRTYEGTVIPEFSQELGENRFTVAVEIPETIALGEAEIVLIRPQKQRLGTNVDQY